MEGLDARLGHLSHLRCNGNLSSGHTRRKLLTAESSLLMRTSPAGGQARTSKLTPEEGLSKTWGLKVSHVEGVIQMRCP